MRHVGQLTAESSTQHDAGSMLQNAFRTKYYRLLHWENQPSGITLSTVIKSHSRKEIAFISSDKVSIAVETKNLGLDPIRIKETPCPIDPKYIGDVSTGKRKKSDFWDMRNRFGVRLEF